MVRRLIGLIRLRNEHPAFSGVFSVLPAGDRTLALRWTHGDHHAELRVEFDSARYELTHSPVAGLAPVTLTEGGVPA